MLHMLYVHLENFHCNQNGECCRSWLQSNAEIQLCLGHPVSCLGHGLELLPHLHPSSSLAAKQLLESEVVFHIWFGLHVSQILGHPICEQYG